MERVIRLRSRFFARLWGSFRCTNKIVIFFGKLFQLKHGRPRVVMMWPKHSRQIIWYRLCLPEYYLSNMITSITSADFSGRSKSLTSLGILFIIRIECKYHSFAAFESAMLTTPEKLLKIMSISEFRRNIYYANHDFPILIALNHAPLITSEKIRLRLPRPGSPSLFLNREITAMTTFSQELLWRNICGKIRIRF